MTEAELEKIRQVEIALDGTCSGCAQLVLSYGRPCGTWECPTCGILYSACVCPATEEEP
jgi:hypothetical protein